MSKEISLIKHCDEVARTTIVCGACEERQNEDQEMLYAVDVFYNTGWRVRKGVCYCPACRKENGIK